MYIDLCSMPRQSAPEQIHRKCCIIANLCAMSLLGDCLFPKMFWFRINELKLSNLHMKMNTQQNIYY